MNSTSEEFGDFETLFPDEYDVNAISHSGKYWSEESLGEDMRRANRCFEYLFANTAKSGFYFVDWRIAFYELYSQLISEVGEYKDDETKKFLEYFMKSAVVLYERLQVFDETED